MTTAASSFIFKLLGKAGLPSRSEPHTSLLQHTPQQNGTSVWVFGFARTGTTTAQALIARALSYNACFEPFGKLRAAELGFSRAHELFLGKPSRETWSQYVSASGVNAALSTLNGTAEGAERRSVFEGYLEALYSKFGRNTVFKEIRLIGNLDAMEKFHVAWGIPWVCVCIHAHPLQPLYTYYRIGALCSRAPNVGNYPEYVYRYRIATYARLGLHARLRSVAVRSISDKLVVACLLDQAHMRAFASNRPDLCVTTSLGDLSQHMGTLSKRTWTPLAEPSSISVKSTRRFAQDGVFMKAIVQQLSPEVKEALASAGHPIPPSPPRASASWRQAATFLRFRLYE